MRTSSPANITNLVGHAVVFLAVTYAHQFGLKTKLQGHQSQSESEPIRTESEPRHDLESDGDKTPIEASESSCDNDAECYFTE